MVGPLSFVSDSWYLLADMIQPVVSGFQPSLTEWFAAIGEGEEASAFREEDNKKTSRLEFLYQTIGLPYERPVELSARDLADKTPEFSRILDERGDELCAIRLVPIKADLPKLRQRGVSIRQCYENWFLKQQINPDDYRAFICPHNEILLWSATFVVGDDKIYGEMIPGLHSRLTHGETGDDLLQFEYDFSGWRWSREDAEAQKQVERMIGLLKVVDKEAVSRIREGLTGEFSHGYLKGYFESTVWPDNKVYIIDYNRILPKYLSGGWALAKDLVPNTKNLVGIPASPGVGVGLAKIVEAVNVSDSGLLDGDVLVCENTDVRFLPLMRKASAIVTERGGVLSHAAIISRELNKPCVIGAKNARKQLWDGDMIEVDGDSGVISKI